MVKKGLKPGDTFVDGGRTYVVLSVCPNGNYISKEYQKAEVEEVPEDANISDVKPEEEKEQIDPETEDAPEEKPAKAKPRKTGR